MAWLLRRGEVLASLDVARAPIERARGLIGHDATGAVLLCTPARVAHTVGVRFPVDVAYLDEHLVVIGVTRLKPFRLGAPRLRVQSILEAEAGSFERWRLQLGDPLEVRD